MKTAIPVVLICAMPSEARALIERPIGSVFRLDSGVVEKIFELTAGRPYLIQKTCIALVSRMHEQGRRSGAWIYVPD